MAAKPLLIVGFHLPLIGLTGRRCQNGSAERLIADNFGVSPVNFQPAHQVPFGREKIDNHNSILVPRLESGANLRQADPLQMNSDSMAHVLNGKLFRAVGKFDLGGTG